METTVFRLLMPEKYFIQSKRLLYKSIFIVWRKYFKDLAVNNVKKNGIKPLRVQFFVEYNTIGISDIIKIPKYLMKKHVIK